MFWRVVNRQPEEMHGHLECPPHSINAGGTFQVLARIMRGSPNRPGMDDTESRLTDDWWNLCCSCWDPNSSLHPSELFGQDNFIPTGS